MSIFEGKIIKAVSSFYYVEHNNTVYTCKAKGNFKKNGINPLVGDNVLFDNEILVVTEILERKNFLIRPPVANIDNIFIISSYQTPKPNFINMDKLIVIAEQQNIEPILVFNKCDLGDMQEFVEVYTKAGFKCIVTSTFNENTCEQIIPYLKNKVSVFTGNSGVGKTSILNILFNNKDRLKTGEVSEKLGRGRHTTRHTELFSVHGGYVADTPGFSAMDMERMLKCDKDDLCLYFRDFENYIDSCKFTSCSHCFDKGCAVLEAVNNGSISNVRHSSYVAIYNELKQIKEY